jgi:hypothetical protein
MSSEETLKEKFVIFQGCTFVSGILVTVSSNVITTRIKRLYSVLYLMKNSMDVMPVKTTSHFNFLSLNNKEHGFSANF